MRTFATAVLFLLLETYLPARDLHLIDGRIFTTVRVIDFQGDKLRLLHDGGVIIIKTAALTLADAHELSVIIPEPVIAGSAPATKSLTDRSYAERDYANRSYGGNTFADRSTVRRTPSEEEKPAIRSPTTYTSSSSGSGTVHVSGYFNKHGTYVHSYTRRR